MAIEMVDEDWKEAHVVFEDKSFTFVHSDEKDHIFAGMQKQNSFYEQELLSALRDLLRPGDWVVDVGANMGSHAIFFAGVCDCNVLAFEPNPIMAEILRKNVEINGFSDKIEIHEVALGSHVGSGDLVLQGTHNLGMVAIREAKGDSGTTCIDILANYVGSRTIRLLKIDVEGMDYEVLAGAEGILARDGFAVSIEAAKRDDYLKIASLMERHGYVAAGSYNYTPTHLFLHEQRDELPHFVRRMSRQASLDYIDQASIREAVHRGRRDTLHQIGHLSSTFEQHTKALPSILSNAQTAGAEAILQSIAGLRTLGVTMETRLLEVAEHASWTRSALDIGTKALRQEIAALDSRSATMETKLHEFAEQASLNKSQLESVAVALRKIEEKIDYGLIGLETKNDQLSRTLSSAASTIDNRMTDILGALSQLDTKVSSRGEKIFQSLQQFEAQLLTRYETAIESTATLWKTVTDWREEVKALFHHILLSAEVDSLYEAAQAQEKNLPAGGDSHFGQHPLSDEAESKTEMSADHPDSTPVKQSKSSSVWHITRKDLGSDVSVSRQAPSAQVHLHERMLKDQQIIADCSLEDDWSGRGWTVGTAALEAGGIVRAIADGEFGFVTRRYAFQKGGIFEVAIDMSEVNEGASIPILSVSTETGEAVSHYAALVSGMTVLRAFAPGRTQELKIRVVIRNGKAGSAFGVRSIMIRRIDPDAHQLLVRAQIGEPVLASMASIPSRREMLADSVNSLLAQCDQVRVFLNNYSDVPEFLHHPRVEVKRSQDWDDRGDAGKVYWLEHDKEPGYRIIVDDDLIFPPDFAEVMCGKIAERGKQVIYATHGVLLRQPIDNYYDTRSRAATFHFDHEVLKDRRVHIGATNALCLHSNAVSMKWADFKYCNSADIWLALHAQEKNLQILTPSRPRYWVRENHHAAPEETIYKHSVNRTKTRFDSSLVQGAALKHSWPLSVRVDGEEKKYGLLLLIADTNGIEEAIAKFVRQYGHKTEWTVMLAYNRKLTALEDAVVSVHIDRETHLIDTSVGINALTQAKKLMEKAGINAILAIDGAALVADPHKMKTLAVGAPSTCHDTTIVQLSSPGDGGIAGLVITEDSKFSADFLLKINGLRSGPSKGLPTLAAAFAKEAPPRSTPENWRSNPSVNGVFERVRVLNLDRRPDRWKQVSASLKRAGIQAERFSAVDGSLPEIAAEYDSYSKTPLITTSSAVPPVLYQTDLYLDYASLTARAAYLERNGEKAITSRGAWGYLKSYEKILEEALEQETESLLVFDDDVLLHKDTEALFAHALKELPDNWLILQLGTLQYNWDRPWMDWHSKMLYRTNGSAIGSHAVGMRFDIIPFLLDNVRRYDMPYDVGALSVATKAFPDRCFVIYPNLAIQSMKDSDIGTSNFQQGKKIEEAAATYRWNLADYR